MYMTNFLRGRGSHVVIATLAFWSSCALGQELWQRAEWRGTPNLPAQAANGKPVRFVRFDLSRLSSHETARITFPLPDGSSIFLVRTEARRSPVGGYVWSGKVEGDDKSIATLSVLNDTLVGDVVVSGLGMYRIEQIGDGIQVVFELGQDLFQQESEPIYVTQPSNRTTGRPIEERCDERVVEMLVVYTEAACKEAFIGDESEECTDEDQDIIRSRIQQAEADTNAIFQNSLASPRVSIVHVALAAGYVEADSLLEVLQHIWVRELTSAEILAGKKAPLQAVHDMRNQHGADVVTLITRRTDEYPQDQACGRSFLLTVKEAWFEENAFTVVPFDCITSNFSFAHELGHVMGADHDPRGFTQPSRLPGNRAHVNASPSGNTVPWRTVMAEDNHDCAQVDPVNGCKRLPYFSNPDPRLKHHGEQMGTNSENNSRVVSSTVDTVSQYRPSLSCNSN
jgi:peptidyl-Asp metalloendopeptidase